MQKIHSFKAMFYCIFRKVSSSRSLTIIFYTTWLHSTNSIPVCRKIKKPQEGSKEVVVVVSFMRYNTLKTQDFTEPPH